MENEYVNFHHDVVKRLEQHDIQHAELKSRIEQNEREIEKLSAQVQSISLAITGSKAVMDQLLQKVSENAHQLREMNERFQSRLTQILLILLAGLGALTLIFFQVWISNGAPPSG